MFKKVLFWTIFSLIFVNLAVLFFVFNKNSQQKTIADGLVKGVNTQKNICDNCEIDTYYGNVFVQDLNAVYNNLHVKIYDEDKVKVFPDPNLGIGSKIVIGRATAVMVDDGGQEKMLRTWQGNIKDFLSEKNIFIGEKDVVSPSLETGISANLKITITRVDVTEVKETEKIVYKIITREDSNLEKGKTRIEKSGAEGLREKTYQVTRENGQEKTRKLLSNEIIKNAEDRIVYVGTKRTIYGTGSATFYPGVGTMTAAHNSLPNGTKVLVTNLANGKSVEVTIADHGIQGEAIIDLSVDAFSQIASLGTGRINVRLEKP